MNSNLIKKNKNFRFLAIANTVARFGDSLETIALSWLVYQLTGSLAMMGALATVNFLPNLIVTPFAGVLADRVNRKNITLIGKIVRGTNALVLFFLILFDVLPVFYLFIYAIINSTFESLGSPSSTAWASELLDKEDYTAGASLMTSFASFGELIGMALAGVIVAGLGIGFAFLFDAINFFVAGALLMKIKYTYIKNEERVRTEKNELMGYLKEIKEGVKYVVSQKVLFIAVMVMSLLNMCFTPMNVLLPAYVDQNLSLGVNGMSMISGLLSAGVMVGGILVAVLVKKISRRWLVVVGYFLVGISYMMLGWIGEVDLSVVWASVLVMTNSFFMGFVIPAIAAPLQGYLFEIVPDDKKGRTFSILSMMTLAMIPMTSAVIAFIGDRVQVTTYFYVMGFAVVLLAVYLYLQKDFKEFK